MVWDVTLPPRRREKLEYKILRVMPLLAILVLAFGAAPVLAVPSQSPEGVDHWYTGDRLDIAAQCGETFTTDIPAGSAFVVIHYIVDGPWRTLPSSERVAFNSPDTKFTLSVDGVLITLIGYTGYDHANDAMIKAFLTHFPDGMSAGTYEFVGTFYFDGAVVLTCTDTVTFA